eukprot:tig00020830_g14483.t1
MELDATGQWSGLELRLADWERTGLLSDAAQDATGSLRRHPSLTAATKEALLEFGQSSEAVRAAFITLLSGHTNPMELGAHCSWSAFLSSDAAQAAMRLLGRHPSLAAVTKEALLEFGQISEAVRAAVIKILGDGAGRGSTGASEFYQRLHNWLVINCKPRRGARAIAPGASATQASSPAIPFIALDSDDEQEPQLAPAPPPQPADPQPRGSASSEPSSQPAAAADSSVTPRRSTRSRRSVLQSGGGGGSSSSSSSSSPSSAAASPAASPHAGPAARGRKREAASPASCTGRKRKALAECPDATANSQAAPAASRQAAAAARDLKYRAEVAVAEADEEEDAEAAGEEGEEAAGNVAEEAAAPEGFFRKTIADVLGARNALSSCTRAT